MVPTSTPQMEVLTSVFAHQGGWDEALLIILPLVALAGLLLLANRRADKRLAQASDRSESSESADLSDGASSAETSDSRS